MSAWRGSASVRCQLRSANRCVEFGQDRLVLTTCCPCVRYCYLVLRLCDCRLREVREEAKRAEARILARRWSVRRRCHQNLLHTGVSMRRADGDTMSVISITSVSAASVCASSDSGLSLMAETMSGIKKEPSFCYLTLHLLLVLVLTLGSVS